MKKILDAHGARIAVERRDQATRPEHRGPRGTVVSMVFPAIRAAS